ncbi:Stp1/IreP family PP2C-type Ser/Thr phosphatase [Paenibacillus sediminis]|uniref:Protein phosphatase n=1 Tax=Paenibacillus sediminis TaxID=664909 RepID=A0ABS4H0D0_9BACL|nr:Stp1/IreP family PP2C-type Ser/Thr phosphatase [Paenibacillus sediminis]MBP1935575.1 protein phosphatase [Paenibacillus sediminis]
MIKAVHVSDVGRVRSKNEDSSWINSLEHGYTLGIVADGMGGHQAGDIASRLAVETIAADLSSLEAGLSLDACKAALSDAIMHANEVIYTKASQDEQYYNMGTTVVAVLLQGGTGVIGHVGDSRAYKVKREEIIQLTEDHTLVNELLKNGQISQEQADYHPHRNVITRALGTDLEVTIDFDHVALNPGEVLLLCSDGLSNLLSTAQMAQVIALQELSLEAKAERLLQLALHAGGDDNITVALFEVVEETADLGMKGWNS